MKGCLKIGCLGFLALLVIGAIGSWLDRPEGPGEPARGRAEGPAAIAVDPASLMPDGAGAFARSKLDELDGFRGSPEFRRLGFGEGSPHHRWLLEVKAAREAEGLNFGEGLALSELLSLGLTYVGTQGEEDDDTRFHREMLLDALRRDAGRE